MASVGHSVSQDLKKWFYRGTAIERGNRGSWNDMSLWTGSVLQTSLGDYIMMITGRSSREAGKIQRLGIFYSKDLYSWTEDRSNPILECDTTTYHPYHPIEKTTTWRDPGLFYASEEQRYYAFITTPFMMVKSRVPLLWPPQQTPTIGRSPPP